MSLIESKDNNKSKVIQFIREEVITDRQTISNKLEINVSTSKRIIDDLLKEGIVVYRGEKESTGGRKSLKFGINYSLGLNLIVKIEVDKVILTLIDFEPKELFYDEFYFKRESSFEDVSPVLKEHIIKLVIEANAMKQRLFAVGIAISGVVSKDSSTLISSTLLGWSNINFKEIVEKWVKIPTYVENDVNCAVIAEHWFGKGKGLDNFALITLGKGTGCGIILNGLLHKGSFGGAGEIGHSIFEKNGRQCYCGQKGCLEMYTNEAYLIEKIQRKITYDGEELESYLAKHQSEIKDVFKDYGQNIVSGIINLMVVLEPQRIIIGGELSYIFDYIKETIQESVNLNWINQLHPKEPVDVVKSDLGPDNFVKGLAIKLISMVLEINF